ncbi:unnamed protein product [Chrysodeixis includens]|uniref:Uncharacterized protein n=1 Tax=Chrysodeixis includens TaxID=689277 RepID=A0A9N8KT48_CHRIL|nr:unnamed protein product [Chrysodeixis includens]
MFRQLVTVAILLVVAMAAPKPAVYYTPSAVYPVYTDPLAAYTAQPLATTYAAPIAYTAYAPYAAYSAYSYSLTSPYTAAYIVP